MPGPGSRRRRRGGLGAPRVRRAPGPRHDDDAREPRHGVARAAAGWRRRAGRPRRAGRGGGSAIIRGIHLEGPWLSPVRAGAHAPGLLRHPDPRELDALLAAGRGRIRMVTIAPELPGALDAIRRIVDAGAVAAIGHTDADYETTRRAIDAGARVATHLFNAMRPLHHREPGPTLALMEDPRVSVELIADGVHLHPALVDGVRDAVGPDRVLLVTDAMDAAGYADGDYRLGELDVEVRGGIARLAGSDTIAGSTATMDAMFRAAAGAVGARSPVGDPTLRWTVPCRSAPYRPTPHRSTPR
ncbi:N-acetylglucosamine-6-phosphate deacetylase [Leucobacter soli]|uniref:N-acetylglucosamine-6-phosphate deacetylase n=1 Tax=Leucobacter soli TaxID=2812850 RepID=UPI00360ECF84